MYRHNGGNAAETTTDAEWPSLFLASLRSTDHVHVLPEPIAICGAVVEVVQKYVYLGNLSISGVSAINPFSRLLRHPWKKGRVAILLFLIPQEIIIMTISSVNRKWEMYLSFMLMPRPFQFSVSNLPSLHLWTVSGDDVPLSHSYIPRVNLKLCHIIIIIFFHWSLRMTVSVCTTH
jgi:hypothetical protein